MAKEVDNTTEQSLESFDWDMTGNEDFFGIAGTSTPKEEVEEKDVKEDKVINEDGKESEEDETEEENEDDGDISFFEDDDEYSEDEGESTLGNDFKSLTKSFKEKGIFQNIDIPEDEDITEEKFIEYQDSEIEARVDEALEGFLEELDDDAAAFLKFKKEGGDTQDFFKTYRSNTSVPKGDLDDEEHQEKLNRYYYSNIEGLDQEEVDDKIEWLKDGGRLARYAEKHNEKLSEIDKKAKEDLHNNAKKQEKLREDARRNFVNSVQETLDKNDEIDNFKFPAKEKKELHAFITKPSVKIDKNNYMTGMQSKLQAALKSPEKLVVLAKLLKNDFAVDDIVAKTTTANTKKIKEDLQRTSKTVRPTSSGKANKKRSLTDFF